MKENKEYYIKKMKDEFGIEWIESSSRLMALLCENALLISRCSKNKNMSPGKKFPQDLYTGTVNKIFYKKCLENNLPFGVLSDLHGICFQDEMYEPYDVHPAQLTEEDFEKLGKIIIDKITKKYPKINTLIFYNTSPKMSLPYFKMIKAAGIKTYFLSKIELINFSRKLFIKKENKK